MRTMLAVVGCLLLGSAALAANIKLSDPTGDDNGPGGYTYPTGAEYTRGCFDLTGVEIKAKGKDVEIAVTFSKNIEDPWESAKWQGNGWSVQMVQLYVDTDHKKGSGLTEALPGMNAKFADDQGYEKVVVISPQPNHKMQQEVAQKAAKLKAAVVLPRKFQVKGKTIVATVDAADLGTPAATWGVQALVGSNEGYPDKNVVFARKVNEMEGPHRFGGGCDYDGDPGFIDCLAPPAKGDKTEIEAQHKALKAYKCGPNPGDNALAVVPMVYAK
ncbi:MAG: hypothetical protein JXR83_02665 [Deltaproteobacteria bacterium]|nr:hypothetical protein [Deltaproteobacteria bacterium]